MVANTNPLMPQLHAALELPTQTQIKVGAGSAMLVAGWCFHTQSAIRDLAVVVNGVRHLVSHQGLARLDIRDAFPDLMWHHGHALTSGFRTIVSLPAISSPKTIEILLEAALETGEIVLTPALKQIVLEPHAPTPSSHETPPDEQPLIAICIPVYNPNRRFLQMQIDSIRAQTYTHWQCFIQDDASDEAAYQVLLDVIGNDTRFHIARNTKNLGSFNNYEATLERAPAQARYVTLGSQDNIWHEDMLQTFLEAFAPDVTLVTSDMIVIDGEERVLSETFWDQRAFEAERLDRLMLANTVSGAATMFRRDLIVHALPFPPAFSDVYDDHWIALNALLRGRIHYIDRPMLRFRHHGSNVVGWPNYKPYDPSEYMRIVRAWTGAAYTSSAWQQQGSDFATYALMLTKRRVWAEVLKARCPNMTTAQNAQLTWIIRMDESPRALRAWMRERGGAARVTMNMEWLLLYASSVERLFARYARQHWQHLHLTVLHPTLSLPFKFNQDGTVARFQRRQALPLSMREIITLALTGLEQRASQQVTGAAAERAALQHQAQQLSVWAGQVLANDLRFTEMRELAYIRSLRAWKVMQGWYGLKARILPNGSRRERAYALVRSSLEQVAQEGPGVFVDRLRRWLRGERRYVRPSAQAANSIIASKIPTIETIVDASSIAPVSASDQTPDDMHALALVEGAGVLQAGLDQPKQTRIEIGTGSALLLIGWAFHTRALITQLAVLINGQRTPVTHFPLARRDIRDQYAYSAAQHGGALNSGFRVMAQLEPVETAQTADIVLEATLETGETLTQIVKTLELLPYKTIPYGQGKSDQPLVAICMATYNPNPRYFREQIESIRAQTYSHWVCLIQDDASNEAAWAMIQTVVGDDARFIVQRRRENAGVYHNFEACLRRAPVEAEYVAFCDQDDIWQPNKLEALLAALTPERVFVYSDHTIIDAKGRVLSETGWIERQHQETDLDRLLLVNHIAGSTCLFRAELLRFALPFPPLLTDLYHDHWLAAVALTRGEIGYVETPLIRYRQHGQNAIGWWNQPPTMPDQAAATLRWWFVASDHDKIHSFSRMTFEHAVWLSEIALWADVLLRRSPTMPTSIAEQLRWIQRMDRHPPVIRAWIRDRGGAPRITLNMEWRILYHVVAEQALSRYAQRKWSQFNPPSRLALLQSGQVSSSDYEALRYHSNPDDGFASIPSFWKVLFPPPALMLHVQEDTDPNRWLRTGREFLHYSRLLAGLQPTESILEIGCGAGRMATAFALYLQTEGRYQGFDIDRESIIWAQQTYRQHWPHIQFQYVDLYNRVYNPQGTIESAAFRFPYPDASFDYTLLTSVFTHMLPRDVAHYWNEIARTLRPGGRALVTAFLINDDSRPHLHDTENTIPLPHDMGVYRVNALEQPERIVAYDEVFMRTLIATSGLALEQIYYGSWCGRTNYLSYQDMMVVRRPG